MSSMFYRDALNALYSFGGIYAAGVLGWSIVQIGIFGILANLTGAIGAWLGGRADQAFGPKVVVSGLDRDPDDLLHPRHFDDQDGRAVHDGRG